jgi:hypothetical protein
VLEVAHALLQITERRVGMGEARLDALKKRNGVSFRCHGCSEIVGDSACSRRAVDVIARCASRSFAYRPSDLPLTKRAMKPSAFGVIVPHNSRPS